MEHVATEGGAQSLIKPPKQEPAHLLRLGVLPLQVERPTSLLLGESVGFGIFDLIFIDLDTLIDHLTLLL